MDQVTSYQLLDDDDEEADHDYECSTISLSMKLKTPTNYCLSNFREQLHLGLRSDFVHATIYKRAL
jgi:hypothetical protein